MDPTHTDKMNEQKIKNSFLRVKQDIAGLYQGMAILKEGQDNLMESQSCLNKSLIKVESQIVSLSLKVVSLLSQKSLNKEEPTTEKESQSCLRKVSEKSQKSLIKSQSSLNKVESQIIFYPKSKIEDRVIKKLRRTKRYYIIKEISMLLEEGKDIPDIKYEIVDEKGLCSKASFYRHIKELSLNKSLRKVSIRVSEKSH